jgi:hypothetical protein
MTRRKKPERPPPKNVVSLEDTTSEEESDKEEEVEEAMKPFHKSRVRPGGEVPLTERAPTTTDGNSSSDNDDDDDDDEQDGKDIPAHELPFCCATCHCPPESSGIFKTQSSRDGPWHRSCCHKVVDRMKSSAYALPIDKAMDTCAEIYLKRPEEGGGQNYVPEIVHYPYSTTDLKTSVHQAMREETTLYDDDQLPAPLDIWSTSPKVAEIQKHHQTLQTENYTSDKCVVLEMFGGIGSGAVALKRLGIKIDKLVHVDQDMVASHVARYNHDAAYGRDGNGGKEEDGTDHVHEYTTFLDIFWGLAEFLKKHGRTFLLFIFIVWYAIDSYIFFLCSVCVCA